MKVVGWGGDHVKMLDQRLLPGEITFLELRDVDGVADGIRNLSVRGAPAIGIAAAYGMALAALSNDASDRASWLERWDADRATLRGTRPTAVNLAWALDRVDAVARPLLDEANFAEAGADGDSPWLRSVEAFRARVLDEARAIDAEDEWMCRQMGDFGAALVPQGARVLTHCNAGGLATGGYGTAVGVIRSAWARDKGLHVFVDETRPLLQGARLTAWELDQEKIPFTLITDNMAGYFMRQGKVDMVVVGADRICANGDVANKIGTYSVAVLAKHHGIPFYVAAPFSTIDLSLPGGDHIVIEQRDPSEVTHHAGRRMAPESTRAANPAFDVTPHELIAAIVTERGVMRAPYTSTLAEAAAVSMART
ncbi:MAG: S-methyl-5-thioribose-1-phosphate isomerase [Armatimonadetes bacterium]|nr:S-methyl-5-thioribose-1-phosphate isomerase [Armatimonadota bacterium]